MIYVPDSNPATPLATGGQASPDERYLVPALVRGLSILSSLSSGPGNPTLSEVAASLAVTRSSAYRLLYTSVTSASWTTTRAQKPTLSDRRYSRSATATWRHAILPRWRRRISNGCATAPDVLRISANCMAAKWCISPGYRPAAWYQVQFMSGRAAGACHDDGADPAIRTCGR